MQENSVDFTRESYRQLIWSFIRQGYSVTSFDAVQADRKDLLIRHDVDFLPEAVLPIADIENEMGVSASYFFLLKSPFYKVQDKATLEVISALISGGHVVGLHFDASLYPSSLKELEQAVAGECKAFESLVRQRIDIISFHRPSSALLGYRHTLAGRPHTYMPEFFNDIGYCSDSRGCWRHGKPIDHPCVTAGRALQLLTHPIWWAFDDAGDRVQALNRVVKKLGPAIRSAIADTVSGYDAETSSINDREYT